MAVWNSTSKTVHTNVYRSLLAVDAKLSEEINQFVNEKRENLDLYTSDKNKADNINPLITNQIASLVAVNQMRQRLDLQILAVINEQNVMMRSELPISLNDNDKAKLVDLAGQDAPFYWSTNNQLFLMYSQLSNDGQLVLMGTHVSEQWLAQLANETGLQLTLVVNAPSIKTISTINNMDYNDADFDAWELGEHYWNLLNPSVMLGLQKLYTLKHPLEPLISKTNTTATANVYISISAERVSGSFISLQGTIASLAFISILIAVVMGIFQAIKITRPIEALAKASKKISKGNYKESIAVKAYSREFDTLAKSFKTMQSSISQRETDIVYQAQHDPLTNLPNRVFAKSYCDSLFSTGEDFQVIIINIKDFRGINDVFGSELADECLKVLATRINLLSGRCMRFTGGKFIWVPSSPCALSDLTMIKRELDKDISTQGIIIKHNTAFGIIDCPKHARCIDSLFRRLTLLIETLRSSKNKIATFTTSLENRYLRRLEVMTQLHQAIAIHHDQLSMVYQPKTELTTGNITKVEALIRWSHPNLGNVPPNEFIKIAEEAGLINALTQWVIETVCKDAKWFIQKGIPLQFSINISADDLNDPDFIATTLALTQRLELPTNHISFELTESALVDEPDKAIQQLNILREAGFTIELDDFGTGYSSLSYLRQLPCDVVKIDRSFIHDICDNNDAKLLYSNIIKFAHDLSLLTIAEGIEDEASLDVLKHLGCDYAQGFFILKPSPKQELFDWMITHV